MILHTVNASPFASLAIANCLKLISDHDTLLLIEDAVIAAQADHPWTQELQQLSEQGRLMVLEADLAARGINNKMGKKCSYADFVDLATRHTSQLAW